jgi:phosphoglycolate phosphatase-like HAD superfamily hydrolase
MANAAAMLIDADGVLYIDDQIAEDASTVLKRMRQAGMPVVVFSEQDESNLRERLERDLGSAVTAVSAIIGRSAERPEGTGFPRPTTLLRTAQAHGFDPFASWMLTARECALRAAEQAGCTGAIWLGPENQQPNARLTLRQADRFSEAPLAMVPAAGGCWHQH